MHILAPLAFTSILLIAACAKSPQDKLEAQAPGVAVSTLSEHNYRCDSGATITATYLATDSATVHYKGSNYSMQIAVSGSGSRYVGGGLEWWTKGSGPGSEGMLLRHLADGTSGESMELCTEY